MLLRRLEEGVAATIGNTPLVRLHHLFPHARFELYGKLESFNPTGSIKDRPALGMLRGALARGEIDADTTVIESSSGNLGAALAQICRFLGLKFICVVDPLVPKQSIRMMKACGAVVKVVRRPDAAGGFLEARIQCVQELLVSVPNSFWCNQYGNPDNAGAHHQTMREIEESLNGPPDYLFCATSSYGTLRGCSEYLEGRSDTKVIAVDAVGSVIHGGPAGKRLIPGHGSSLVPGLFRRDLADAVMHVSDLDCVRGCRTLLYREAILAGGSSGGVIQGVSGIMPEIEKGSRCVAILCDSGTRYLDTIYSDRWVKKKFGAVPERLVVA